MAYTKTDWENLPSTNTPLNRTNLSKIENELKFLDDNAIQEQRKQFKWQLYKICEWDNDLL